MREQKFLRKNKPKPETKTKPADEYSYAMTGNFGYKRAIIPLVLRSFGYRRVRYVNK